jgi:uncharacterized protein
MELIMRMRFLLLAPAAVAFTWLGYCFGAANQERAKGRPIVHFEIGCKDVKKTSEFYSKLFDWKIDQLGTAAMIKTGADNGVDGHITALGHEPHNYVTIYAEVDDIPAYLDKAKELGGITMVTQTPVPGQGHFAWIKDPEGNIIALWKPKRAK